MISHPHTSVHFSSAERGLTIAAIFDAIVPDRRSGDDGHNCGIVASPRWRRQRRSGPSSPPPPLPTTIIGGRGGRKAAAPPEVGGSVDSSAAAATAVEIIAVVDIDIIRYFAPAPRAPPQQRQNQGRERKAGKVT